jgi:hypothetical protein
MPILRDFIHRAGALVEVEFGWSIDSTKARAQKGLAVPQPVRV